MEQQPLAPIHHRDLPEIFQGYGVRYITIARIGELGFTSSTLAMMREEEIDDMMATMCHVFRWDLLVGERYGIKAAARAERRRMDEEAIIFHHHQHHLLQLQGRTQILFTGEAISQEGISEEKMHEYSGEATANKIKRISDKANTNPNKKKKKSEFEEELVDSGSDGSGIGFAERQREHPFIVTEPGEVARAKKNGLDYLFHLFDQCREFLVQVQAIAKEKGEKCPTKVTNQVFRHAKKVGASYINKPKMRHYVHCYALHCLDRAASDALRKDFKNRGENVGQWRQACYKPLVALSARSGYDIDAVFNASAELSVWYVPTKLRQMCHAARGEAAALPAGTTMMLSSTTSLMF